MKLLSQLCPCDRLTVEDNCVQRTGIADGGELEFRPPGTAAD